MKYLGKHTLIELTDCDEAALNNSELIESSMVNAAKESGATVVSSHINHFNPYGISGVVVIAESHITIHTWPEYSYAAVDVFTCGSTVDSEKIMEIIARDLKAKHCKIDIINRGPWLPFQEPAKSYER